MGIYEIRQVEKAEKNKIQKFIDCHWKKNHSLAVSDVLLDFQHLNGDSYTFIAAVNKETKEYDALVGFIPTSQYDRALEDNGDYWGAIWKIREDVNNDQINAAGFAIWKKLFKLPHFQSYAAIGISEIAKRIYVASRLNVSYLRQYYILNGSTESFRIAKDVEPTDIKAQDENDDRTIGWIDADGLARLNVKPHYRPQKSMTYLINRYARHPIYKYRFLGVYSENGLQCILVTRDVNVNGAKAIRIVDAVGRLGGVIGSKLEALLIREKAEYIDCLNYGIPEDVFFEMGFSLLDFNGKLVIPNYFEPFEQRNVRIDIAYKADFEYVAFKGDSDQDRPSLIFDKTVR